MPRAVSRLLIGSNLLLLAAAIYLAWRVHRQREQHAADVAEMAEARHALDQAAIRAKQEAADLQALQTRVAQLAPANSVPFETALDTWLGKVKALSDYLAKHPSFRIPQMTALSDEDWLDVTKGKDLATDADYRQALGHLRGLARQKFTPKIAAALKAAIQANGGNVPTDLSQVAQYLPSDVDPAVVGQLALNPSGTLPNFRLFDAAKTKVVVVDKAVDLWDGTGFYTNTGGAGSRAAYVAGETDLRAAIEDFTAKNGVAPTSPSQVAGFKGVGNVDPAVLNELFTALTTQP